MPATVAILNDHGDGARYVITLFKILPLSLSSKGCPYTFPTKIGKLLHVLYYPNSPSFFKKRHSPIHASPHSLTSLLMAWGIFAQGAFSPFAVSQEPTSLPSVTESPPPTTDFREFPRSSDAERVIFALRFPSAVTTPYPENNTVEVEVIKPRDGPTPMPVVIVLHYWGATSFAVEERFATALNERGIAV
ncbi:MAG: hypothetical protein QXI19_03860, partial [Candidatus Caldarchaeum sp.]